MGVNGWQEELPSRRDILKMTPKCKYSSPFKRNFQVQSIPLSPDDTKIVRSQTIKWSVQLMEDEGNAYKSPFRRVVSIRSRVQNAIVSFKKRGKSLNKEQIAQKEKWDAVVQEFRRRAIKNNSWNQNDSILFVNEELKGRDEFHEEQKVQKMQQTKDTDQNKSKKMQNLNYQEKSVSTKRLEGKMACKLNIEMTSKINPLQYNQIGYNDRYIQIDVGNTDQNPIKNKLQKENSIPSERSESFPKSTLITRKNTAGLNEKKDKEHQKSSRPKSNEPSSPSRDGAKSPVNAQILYYVNELKDKMNSFPLERKESSRCMEKTEKASDDSFVNVDGHTPIDSVGKDRDATKHEFNSTSMETNVTTADSIRLTPDVSILNESENNNRKPASEQKLDDANDDPCPLPRNYQNSPSLMEPQALESIIKQKNDLKEETSSNYTEKIENVDCYNDLLSGVTESKDDCLPLHSSKDFSSVTCKVSTLSAQNTENSSAETTGKAGKSKRMKKRNSSCKRLSNNQVSTQTPSRKYSLRSASQRNILKNEGVHSSLDVTVKPVKNFTIKKRASKLASKKLASTPVPSHRYSLRSLSKRKQQNVDTDIESSSLDSPIKSGKRRKATKNRKRIKD